MQDEHTTPTIKRISRTLPERPVSRARNADEALIEEIVGHCRCRSEKDARTLAKRIAIAAKTFKWDTADLHGLLQKRNDPSVRNYGGLVNHLVKVRVAKTARKSDT